MRLSWNACSASEELRAIRGAAADAIILGSGLAGIAERSESLLRIPYARITRFGVTSVEGHPGFVSLGRIAGTPVLFFAGRFHAYEGIGAGDLISSVALAASAGCSRIIVTQAAGSLTRRIRPGTWMLATGVLSFPGCFGPNLNRVHHLEGACPAFRLRAAPGLSKELATALREAALEAHVPLAEGVLCWTNGPTYETAAEGRAAEIMGADAVTMSSLPELLAARDFALEAASLSWITNDTAHVSGQRTDHARVVEMGEAGGYMLEAILAALVRARGAP